MPIILKKGMDSLFSFKNTILFFSGAFGILLLTIFIILRFQQQNSFLEQQRLTISLREDINRHLETSFSETTRALTKQDAVVELFTSPNALATQRATIFLNSTREILGTSLIYIMDTTGTVIASSFSETGETLFGNNYRFRPYFSEAMKGNTVHYAALGVTTKKRGLYFSSPIRDDNLDIQGVAVLKSGLDTIDKILLKAAGTGPTALVSRDGVLFAASEESWLFHTATVLDEQKRLAIIGSGQFADEPLTPLPLDLTEEEVSFEDRFYTVQSQQINLDGWQVITLVPKKSAFFLIVLVCFCFTVPLYFFFLKLKHFASELRYKDKINKQNVHLRRLNEEMKKEIEERRETEKKLKRVSEQELRYRTLFEQSKDAITIVSEDGRFLEANMAFLSMMDCTKEEIRTLSPKDFWYDQSDRARWFKLLKEQGSIIDYLSKQVTRKGTVLDLNLTTNATMNREGDTVYLSILRDITDKLQDQKELIAAKTAAEQGSLAKSRFLANMSHEIRTPMNGIIGMTSIVLESDLQPEQRNYLEMVRSSADRLLDIINNILDFSKIEAGRLELEEIEFNLIEKFDELVSLMLIRAQNNNVDLSADITPEVPTHLMGDPTRLMQILINLTNNAVKFTRDGTVKIAVRLEETLSTDRILLRFTVEDTGVGVSKEKQTAIFESFAQADSSTTRQFGGTGLGLTISSQLCRLMDGEIGLESEENKGSLFWFTAAFRLPELQKTREEDAHGVILSSAMTREEIFRDITILLVEDDYINRTLALAVLEKAQLNVTTVTNGVEAVEESARHPYNIILMDIQMPELDGYDATRVIRERERFQSRHTPIIAMTAHAIKGDREKCLEAGMDDYITKPISPTELYTAIERHLLYRVLVADGDGMSLSLAGRIFTEIGWQVTLAENSSQCLWEGTKSSFNLVIVDVLTADIHLEEIASLIRDKNAETGRRTRLAAMSSIIDSGVQSRCTAAGITDILEKPLTTRKISTLINTPTMQSSLHS